MELFFNAGNEVGGKGGPLNASGRRWYLAPRRRLSMLKHLAFDELGGLICRKFSDPVGLSRQTQTGHMSVAVLDVWMPQMTFGSKARVRARLAETADYFHNRATIRRARDRLNAGAIAFLTKPFERRGACAARSRSCRT